MTLPPPVDTANVTETPETGLLFASRAITDGDVDTALPAVALWLFPPFTAIWVAAPAAALAVKVSGLPARPADVAVIVLLFVPAVEPRVQLPTVTMPEAFVV